MAVDLRYLGGGEGDAAKYGRKGAIQQNAKMVHKTAASFGRKLKCKCSKFRGSKTKKENKEGNGG